MKMLQFRQQEQLFLHAAELFTRLSLQSIDAHDRFTVLLPGGTTPLPLFRLLASKPWRSQVDWEHVFVGWSDERCVAPTHKASNFHSASESLLSQVPIPKANILRIEGEGIPDSAAAAYEHSIRSLLGKQSGVDLAILGLGADGHTASLFPGHMAWQETERWYVSERIATMPQPWRITATLPLLNASRRVMFLVTGEEKAEAFARIRRREWLPATLVRSSRGDATWLVDRAALGPSRPHR